ncbi:exosome complex protein Rrp42 [archaeon]|nr:exosome complex protein Rrp42 [archaeon]
MSGINVSNLQKKRIIEYLKEGKRFDGRLPSEYRDMEIKLGISGNAESSCSVKFGKTEVYAGVKMAVVTPYPDNADEGTFMTTMELGPMADNNFDAGAPRIEAIEMGRVIDRGIRESGFIKFKDLCIKEGEKVWQVFLDLYAVNNDGNLFDVAGLAALIALANAKMPVYNEETEKIEHEFTKNPLPLDKEKMSFNITVHKVGDKLILDPSRDEEGVSDYRLSIALADNAGEARITAMQKGKEGGIDAEDMQNILKLIEEQFSEMFPKISKIVWGK